VTVGDARLEMHARLDHRLAAPLRSQARLDRRQDLVVGDPELFDVEAVQIGDVDRRHAWNSSASAICLYIIAYVREVNLQGNPSSRGAAS